MVLEDTNVIAAAVEPTGDEDEGGDGGARRVVLRYALRVVRRWIVEAVRPDALNVPRGLADEDDCGCGC